MSIPKPGAPLTIEETEILGLFAAGLNYDEVGERMRLSSTSIKAHTTRIRRKLSALNTTHAVAIGYCTGLLPANPAGPAPVVPGRRRGLPQETADLLEACARAAVTGSTSAAARFGRQALAALDGADRSAA